MFTGLIERLGHVAAVEELPGARRFTFEVDDDEFLENPSQGESISGNGVCLTALDLRPHSYSVVAVEETLRRTTLGALKVGDEVNLERALKVSARLGGHIVQGHVDGVADVVGVREEGESLWITFQPPFVLLKYIVEKGSICLDGISLTVANTAYDKFSVALIPHTREVTNAKSWMPGALVNVEVDVLAKYIERLSSWTRAEGQARGGESEMGGE
jgi:riboflavin synthase